MDFGFELLKALVALLIVLGLLVAVLKYVKGRILPQRGVIEMLHYQALGPKRGLAIIRVAKEHMLIGVGDQGISLLTRLDGKDIEDALKQASAVAPPHAKTLGDWFREKFGGGGA